MQKVQTWIKKFQVTMSATSVLHTRPTPTHTQLTPLLQFDTSPSILHAQSRRMFLFHRGEVLQLLIECKNQIE